MATTMVHIRVDDKVKKQAAKTLASMGISVSDAVRMLLVRVAAEKALPFDVKVPNTRTVKALQAANRGEGKRYKSADALFRGMADLTAVKRELLGRRYAATEIPPCDVSGVYAFFIDDPTALDGFQVDGAGPLYIGMTESSMKVRNHFGHQDSGFSTLRRSLGAILKHQGRLMKVIPRGTGDSASNFRNFRFSDECESALTGWMVEHLTYNFVALDKDIKAVECQLIENLCPPLNLKGWLKPQSRELRRLRKKLRRLRGVCRQEACDSGRSR